MKLENMFNLQMELQKGITGSNFPVDDIKQFHYSMTGLMCEMGEVLQADKRWKNNGRNSYYNRQEKLEELSDYFAFLINACIYSGFSVEEIYGKFIVKNSVNNERLKSSLEKR